MLIVRSPAEMKNLSLTLQKGGDSIGLVPTMGALHDGHLSLVNIAKKNCDTVVMSIFVNPVQFGPNEDFKKYPRPFQEDCQKAQDAGVDIIFAPSPQDMYPQNFSTYVEVDRITDLLCGASRPGHFRGVATVVLKFFNIVLPQVAIFGQKDAQQLFVIKRMVRDLNCPVRIISAPIFREHDGLAMSSRNVYLTPAERADVPLIFQSLQSARKLFEQGTTNASVLIDHIRHMCTGSERFKIEYVEIVDTIHLQPVDTVSGAVLLAIACKTTESATRLIDNVILGGDL